MRGKKINAEKISALEKLLANRVLLKQALLDRLRETAEFRNRVHDQRVELIVGVFIRRVVLPEVSVTEGEIEQHYRDHLDDYSLPAFVRAVDSLSVF